MSIARKAPRPSAIAAHPRDCVASLSRTRHPLRARTPHVSRSEADKPDFEQRTTTRLPRPLRPRDRSRSASSPDRPTSRRAAATTAGRTCELSRPPLQPQRKPASPGLDRRTTGSASLAAADQQRESTQRQQRPRRRLGTVGDVQAKFTQGSWQAGGRHLWLWTLDRAQRTAGTRTPQCLQAPAVPAETVRKAWEAPGDRFASQAFRRAEAQ
jgi:hypothetical protein